MKHDTNFGMDLVKYLISLFFFTGIVVGSVVGGLLLILLVAVVVGAIVCRHRKKSRVTLTFDLDAIKASQ